MSVLSIKRHNHRVYFCDIERQEEMLSLLCAEHQGRSIALVSELSVTFSLPEGVAAHTPQSIEGTYDLIISIDLPDAPERYIARLAYAASYAFVLLPESKMSLLYPIEQILGRSLVQERIEGFADAIPPKPVAEERVWVIDREAMKSERDTKPKRPGERGGSKYLGKDAQGKAIFDRKSGERNHRFDGSAKTDADRTERKPYRDEKRPYDREKKPFDGEKKRFDGERKPFNGEKKSFDGPRKPYDGEKKPYNGPRKPYDGEKRSFDGDKKPFDGPRKPYDGEKKSYNGPRKPYDGERKPYDGEKKSFDGPRKPYDGERKSFDGEKKPFDGPRKPFDPSKKRPFGGERKEGRSFDKPKSFDKPHAPSKSAPSGRPPKKVPFKGPKKP